MDEHPLEWQGTIPRSRRFHDIYYNPDDPLGESRHVFLQGSQLDTLIQQHPHLVLAETGFGTGLNFLATWQHWQRRAQPGQWLRYYSIEGYPLLRTQLRKALQPIDEIAGLAEKLLEQYPDDQRGWHSLIWPEDRVELILLLEPVTEALSRLAARVHGWYLDGFAPARNPEMWSDTVMDHLARLSQPGTRLATFTAAGAVRRGLAARGFKMAKRAGFGNKREMLTGIFQRESQEVLPNWMRHRAESSRQAIVVGAGIAGAQVAWHLHQAGMDVVVVDQAERAATGGSGNPRGLLSPALHADGSLSSRFYQQACGYAWRQISHLQKQYPFPAQAQGIHRLLAPEETARFRQALQKLGIGKTVADIEQATLPDGTTQPALHWKTTGWVEPAGWIDALLQDIPLHTGFKLERLLWQNGHWRLEPAHGPCLEAPVVVLCQALDVVQLPCTAWLPLRARPGHLLHWPVNDISGRLQTPLTGKHYLLPPVNGYLLAGSSFEHLPREAWLEPLQTEPRHMAQLASRLQQTWSWLGEARPPFSGRRAMRAVTPDHLPLTGPAPDQDAWQGWLAPHQRGMALKRLRGQPENLPGLFLLTGLGARGLLSAPLAAALLRDWLLHPGQFCLPIDVVRALHPGRFLLRQCRKGQQKTI